MSDNEDILPTLNDKIKYDIDDERITYIDKKDKKKKLKKKVNKENKKKEKEREEITPITIINSETINNTNNFFSLNNVFCAFHLKEGIKFDTKDFSIVCTKCIEEGKESQLQFSNLINKEIINKEKKNITEDIITCNNHNNKKGSFYCDECKEFICKFCFAENHRKHKCHLPEIISEEFKNYIYDSINNTKKLKPVLDKTIDEVSEISSNLKIQKNDILKVPSSSIVIITNNNNNQIANFLDKFNLILNNLDDEVFSDFERHEKIKEKIQIYKKEISEISKKLKNENNNLNNFQLCIYHKTLKEKVTEIEKFISTSFNFLNIKLVSLIEKCEKSKPNILNDLNLLNKSISNYENTSMSSILTGQASNSILLRRFLRFIHNEIKFFKNTSLLVKANSQIFLSGLSICGIYINRKKIKDPNNDYNNNLSNRPSLNIRVNIFSYDIESGIKGENIFEEEFVIYGIVDSNNPSQIINFSKGVKFQSEKYYLITIENFSNVSYCDLWVGSVGNYKHEGVHTIKCHNTNIEFEFKETKGIQTDFDEFNSGLIEGILFCKT